MTSSVPVITRVTPLVGPAAGGTIVTIYGRNLCSGPGTTSVIFDITTATTLLFCSSTLVRVLSPSHSPGWALIRVHTTRGSSQQAFYFNYQGVLPPDGVVPVINDVVPLRGPSSGGNTVSIVGTSFTTVTEVNFGSTPASFAILSDTEISAIAPPSATDGPVDITVTNEAGISNPAIYTYYTFSQPTVTGVSPNQGPSAGGNTVVITGTGFTCVTAVTFGGTAALSFTILSDSSISAVVPPGPPGGGDATVLVSCPGGSSTTGPTYVYSPSIPVINTLNPSSGPLAGGNTVTILGTNLETATGVIFGDSPATAFTILSANTINAVVPQGSSPGPVSVVVQAPGGSSESSTYIYIATPVPVGVSVCPGSGSTAGGTPVVITGIGFSGTASVLFGTSPATITSVTNTELDIITPPHVQGTVPISITTPEGTDSSLQFTFRACPVIYSIDPASGPATGGNTVVITGANLSNVTSVTFGSAPATAFTILSDTLLSAVVPAAVAGGIVCVTVTAPGCPSTSIPYQYI